MNILHHKVTMTKGTATGRPYHAQCACGVGGDFGGAYDAQMYFANHFRGLSGISTYEFTASDEVAQEIAPTPETQPAPEISEPEAEKPDEVPEETAT